MDNKYRRKSQNDRAINKHMIASRKQREKTIDRTHRKPDKIFIIENINTVNQVPDLMKDVDIENSVKKAIEILTRTKCYNSNEMLHNSVHASNICVICDTFIIGMEPIE